jgi:hypothetical protein
MSVEILCDIQKNCQVIDLHKFCIISTKYIYGYWDIICAHSDGSSRNRSPDLDQIW